MIPSDLPRLSEHIAANGSAKGFVATARKRRKRDNRESRLQKSVIAWWRVAAPRLGWDARLLISVPNGAVYGIGQERVIRAKILKDEGLAVGYPDLQLDVARGDFHGLRIEMKLPETGPDEAQLSYHALLCLQGYAVHVARSLDEAKDCILNYLNP